MLVRILRMETSVLAVTARLRDIDQDDHRMLVDDLPVPFDFFSEARSYFK